MTSMSNRCHRWVIDRPQNFWPSISHRLPIVAHNQWLINWLPNEYSSITHWCHSSSIWQRLGFFAPLWSQNGYRFCPFCSGIGYGFGRNYGCVSMCLLFQFQMNKKESALCEFETNFKKSFCNVAVLISAVMT